MAQIKLKINDRTYEMTCDDGQENHLLKLAAHVDERMRELAGTVGQVGEARLLIMASLMISDELFDAHHRIQVLEGDAEATASNGAAENGALESELAAALESGTERIEALAARLATAGNRGA